MSDGDRQRRSERVDPGQQAHVAGNGDPKAISAAPEIATYGVEREPSLPSQLGTWRLVARTYTCRDSPSIEVLAAQASTAGAIATTATCRTVESQAGS